MSKKRDAEFDIVKGILILCVVIGHGGSDSIADFISDFLDNSLNSYCLTSMLLNISPPLNKYI